MHILIAPDKFKGSLSAVQVCEAVQRGLQRVLSDAVQCHLCPIADGGEGFTEALTTALGAAWIDTVSTNALFKMLPVCYGLTSDGTAIMEMSAASGLDKLKGQSLQPAIASTYGTGVMMRDAIERGASKIIIGIGGSATNDGGIGMAEALGYQFFDAMGGEVTTAVKNFERVTGIRPMTAPWPEVLVACDVDNPLLGERGATRVYGAQKGVTDFDFFEARLERLAAMVQRDLGCDFRNVPGAGAAGGLGFGLMTFCGAKLINGFDLVAEVLALEARITQCDLVITGEGRIDAQTLHGKGPAGVAALARRHGKPVVAIGGSVEDSEGLRACFDAAFASKPPSMPLAEAMERGAELIEETVVQHAQKIRELGAARSRGD